MAQTVYPTSDITVGTWLNEAAGGTLWSHIDESVIDDADYIRAADCDQTLCEVKFDTLTDPNASANHIISFRYRKQGAASNVDCNVTVMCGGTTIATTAATNISTSWTTGTYTLSSSEADAITDYTDIRVRFAGGLSGGACVNAHLEVSWTSFAVPDPTITVTPSTAPDITFAALAPDTAGTGNGVYIRTPNNLPELRFTGLPVEVNVVADTIEPRLEPPHSFDDLERGRVCFICRLWCPAHALTYIDGRAVCARHNYQSRAGQTDG